MYEKANNEKKILDALKAFKKTNGRAWKSKLKKAWTTGNYSEFDTNIISSLQRARNINFNLKKV